MRIRAFTAALALAAALAAAAQAGDFDWTPLREESVIEVLTADEDGALRETPVWVVVLDGAAYVRTNDSTWLANIRRGSATRVRVRDEETAMDVVEVADAALGARVETAFLAKYGFTQRVMSALRMREPTVLRLTPKQ
jgi:hypothetical protein